MKLKWGKKEEANHLRPKSDEIYRHIEKNQTMLMQGEYFANGNRYYEYTTFDKYRTKETHILQHEFERLRAEGKIVKIKIDAIQMSQIV